jgi:antitoxin CptB
MRVSDKRLERIRWRCRRGMLELDLTLQRFTVSHLATLGGTELDALEELLALPDNDLLEVVLGHTAPSAATQRLVQLMRQS